ncbi:hypothetical protein BDR26DRAFT_852184 [Obelidium mucronatum]|nr:hypothetical protein BDR26DRAFT_852184 [Obelidium mucronatum]
MDSCFQGFGFQNPSRVLQLNETVGTSLECNTLCSNVSSKIFKSGFSSLMKMDAYDISCYCISPTDVLALPQSMDCVPCSLGFGNQTCGTISSGGYIRAFALKLVTIATTSSPATSTATFTTPLPNPSNNFQTTSAVLILLIVFIILNVGLFVAVLVLCWQRKIGHKQDQENPTSANPYSQQLQAFSESVPLYRPKREITKKSVTWTVSPNPSTVKQDLTPSSKMSSILPTQNLGDYKEVPSLTKPEDEMPESNTASLLMSAGTSQHQNEDSSPSLTTSYKTFNS